MNFINFQYILKKKCIYLVYFYGVDDVTSCNDVRWTDI